jgi:hypothetical protein
MDVKRSGISGASTQTSSWPSSYRDLNPANPGDDWKDDEAMSRELKRTFWRLFAFLVGNIID